MKVNWMALAVIGLAILLVLSGCIQQPDDGQGDVVLQDKVTSNEEASETMAEIGTAMNSLIAELEGIDTEIT